MRSTTIAAGKSAEIFDSLYNARRTRAVWRHDHYNVWPHSSLVNKTPTEAHRALEHSNGTAPGALTQTETDPHQTEDFRDERGTTGGQVSYVPEVAPAREVLADSRTLNGGGAACIGTVGAAGVEVAQDVLAET